jgi:predicted DNA binding CopG/RHH family protein
MRKVRLTREEKEIEDALIKGEYVDVSEAKFKEVAQAIEHRKKDTVLNIRVNSYDLKSIKQKAKKYGVKYQSFISEFIHQLARG